MEDHTPPSSHPTPDGNAHAAPPPPAAAVTSPPAIPRCSNCGYELTGIRVDGNCPECGALVWGSSRTPPTSGYAVASLVLGIISIVSCVMYGLPSFPLGVLGVIFGEVASRQHKRGSRAGGTYGMALAGRICSWIGIVIGGVVIAFVVWAVAVNR